ncbi:MAG: Long-chain-fatty-acid--CoA ligase FadD15 [Candidatus Omnitrophica bacterium]|nr:Long-chain-fatty-acid--CoA ligase FadD15 [Candidatus Omnitrophota bacterium]
MTLTPRNLGDLLASTVSDHGRKRAMLFRFNGRYESYTWEEVGRKTAALAKRLVLMGLKPGDRLAILSENRPEWALTDLAAQTAGIVTVPIYPSLTSDEVAYILKDSQSRCVALSGRHQLDKLVPVRAGLQDLRCALAFDGDLTVGAMELGLPFTSFTEATSDLSADLPSVAVKRSHEDLATLIYTSGTTGVPKGVMLTHGNLIENAALCRQVLRMGPEDVHLSFLPLCHIFERLAGHYLMVSIGATIAYAENMDTVPRDLQAVRPTFVLGVPRFFEKIRGRVLDAVSQASPFRRLMFGWAQDIGRRIRTGERVGALARLTADRLVFSKFRARLGGRVRFCVSGGAPLPKEIAEFFADLGVVILEGYGLTETSPVITVNLEREHRFGTVGRPLPGVELRLSEEVEVLTRSACVMKGYYNKPAETADVLRDGWFHTGDLGRIDAEGYLTITGRKKELICTSGGKKISPRPIEESIEKDPAVLRCVLYGEGKRFITALIVPDRAEVERIAHAEKLAYTDYADLLRSEHLRKLFGAMIEERTASLAGFEKIKYFALLEEDFSASRGELTPTLKVKRDIVLRRYAHLLDPYYDEGPKPGQAR